MTVPVSLAEWDLALRRCADEQIQFIGQIQSGFTLLAIDLEGDRFTYLSENAGAALGLDLNELFALKPSELLGAAQLSTLSRRAFAWNGKGARLVEIALQGGASLPAWLHLSGKNLVIEMDRSIYDDDSVPESWDWEDMLRESLKRVENCPDLPSKLEAVVEDTTRLGGFDRVMIYRFLPDGTGEVVAERVRSDWEPYLGLRYPATDIPQQARELFLRNDIRLIREVASTPEALLGLAELSDQPLDLSLSRFRQPSPIHLEYLKNMGVRSSFVTAVISEGKLWGLISCHHGEPLNLPSARQAQLAALTNHLAIDLAGLAREIRLRNELACARITSKLIQCITVTDNWASVLMAMAGELCEILDSEGMALIFDESAYYHGLVPSCDAGAKLIEYAMDESGGMVFPFARDPHGPDDQWLPEEIGGALIIPLSHFRNDALVFYRKERTHKVNWAGDPMKVIDRSDGVPRLKPRESFAIWQETVRGTCEPWSEEHVIVAGVIRATLSDIVITAHYFRQSLESPGTTRHRLAHENDPNPVVLADENGLVVFQNSAASNDLLLNNLQSLDLLVSRLKDGKSLVLETALHALVQGDEDITIELAPDRWLEAKRLIESERLVGYSIRITGER